MIDTVSLSLNTTTPEQIISALKAPEYRTRANCISTKIIGNLENLKVLVVERDGDTRADIYLRGSLSKYHLGNNAETLNRRGVQEAIQSISDYLHHDVSRAQVRGRLDIGRNLIMKCPPEQYFSMMHSAPYMEKAFTGDTLYFQNNMKVLALYDKAGEMQKRKEALPRCFHGRYVLRYETRYLKRTAYQLKKPELLVSDLYCSDMYSELVKNWKQAYFSIKKQKGEVALNMGNIHSFVHDLAFFGILTIGADQIKTQIISAYRAGKINRQQKHRFISKLREIATTEKEEHTSELIRELDSKIIQASRYSR